MKEGGLLAVVLILGIGERPPRIELLLLLRM